MVSRQVSRAVDVLAGVGEQEREGRLQGEVEHVIVYAHMRASSCVCVRVQVRCACLLARVHFALPLAF